MIFSLFWEGAFIRREAFIRGGAFILKSEILGGVYSWGAFIRGGVFIRGNTVAQTNFHGQLKMTVNKQKGPILQFWLWVSKNSFAVRCRTTWKH